MTGRDRRRPESTGSGWILRMLAERGWRWFHGVRQHPTGSVVTL